MSMNNDPRWIFIPFTGFLILIVFGLICVALGFRYKKRELQHRERLAALEKGIAASELAVSTPPWTPRVYLLRGLMWLFAGFGLTVLLLGLSLSLQSEEPAASRAAQADYARQRGATPDEVREILNDRSRSGPPMGLALLGLIPMGVGLAYLITYRAERGSLTPR